MDQWNTSKQTTVVDSQVEELTLYGPTGERIHDIFGLEKLTKIKSLRIDGLSWTLYTDRILPRIKDLKELIINAETAEEKWNRLNLLKNIEVFILTKNSGFITNLSFAPGIRMKIISLPHARHMPTISGAVTVEVIDLSFSSIPPEEWLEIQKRLPSVKRIYIDSFQGLLPESLPPNVFKEGIQEIFRMQLPHALR